MGAPGSLALRAPDDALTLAAAAAGDVAQMHDMLDLAFKTAAGAPGDCLLIHSSKLEAIAIAELREQGRL